MTLIIKTVNTRINTAFLIARIYDSLACFENKFKRKNIAKGKETQKKTSIDHRKVNPNIVDNSKIVVIGILLIRFKLELLISNIKRQTGKNLITEDDGYGFGPIKYGSDRNNKNIKDM